MKQLAAFITSIALSPVVWVETISPVSAQASCQATVDNIAGEISQKGTTVEFDSWKTDIRYNNPLANSKRVYHFHFTFNSFPRIKTGYYIGENIMYSPVLMKSYSDRIFSNCIGTGYVSYAMSQGGSWVEEFAMKDDGTLAYYKCDSSSRKITNAISKIEENIAYGGYCAYVIPEF